MRVAAVNWKIRSIAREGEFFDHLGEVIEECVGMGADWAVLPEYCSFELLGALGARDEREVAEVLAPLWHPIVDALQAQSDTHKISIVGGSHICGNVNRCPIIQPSRAPGDVDKHVLTQYELDPMALSSGTRCATAGLVGACVCYDSEFPAATRALAEAGVKLLAVPAFTETPHGFHRVRRCCEARAIENQIYVVHSSLVGSLGGEPVTSATGSSAIIGPCIEPFPPNGIIAETPMDEEAVVCADLDLTILDQVRETGDVRNWQDRDAATWTPQPQAIAPDPRDAP